MRKLSGGCTLDCFDACKFNVYTENNKIIKIEGDKNHPYTKGFICHKGLKHINRHTHPLRQYKPLLKVDNKWEEISFDKALDIISEKLSFYKENHGVNSLMYYEQYGSGSLLKSIGEIFFNFFGGSCKQKGGPCWSGGMYAQKRNFGDSKSHSLEDMLNSKNIIIWGKNPANTSIHTMNAIKKAKKKGSYIIVIDPIKTDTAKMADFYLQTNPGSDLALALAMGKRILDLNLHDKEFIKEHVKNFEEYEKYLETLDINDLCEICGVTLKDVDFLVKKYTEKYSTILEGYGMQKYIYGGETIGAINTLSAITGQIGKSGGGVNYANKVFPHVLNTDPYNSEQYARDKFFYVSHISNFIEENNIKMAVITNSNLMAQLPSLNKLQKAMEKVEFKVCFDLFLTDTAEVCDLFIPCTTVFEGEDLLYSSMTNPYLTYIEKALEPQHKLMDEYYFFQELARRLNIKNYPYVEKNEYLKKVIQPLRKIDKNINLKYLSENYFTLHKSVPWKDYNFKTPSGKFEIFSYEAPLQKNKINEEYPFRLMTNHSRESLFSQHYMDKEGKSSAYINSKMSQKYNLNTNDLVKISSKYGEITAKLQIDDCICDNVIMMYAGYWKKHGNPNYLIKSTLSNIGGQVAYNETFVKITNHNNICNFLKIT